MNSDQVTHDLASFSVNTCYEGVPAQAVHEIKILLMDSLGCALAGLSADKGKMMVGLSKQLGGAPESSIIGISGKVSSGNAALANGELIGTVDYDATMSGGHAPPYVIPAPLAIAELVNVSGKDLILALSLGFELSARVAAAVQQSHGAAGPTGDDKQKFSWGTRWGQAYSNFGAAAGAGRLLNLTQDQMENALGISGHLCQVLTHERYTKSAHRPMSKYGMPGWQSTGAVNAALLARMGYLGDTTVFDPEEGFWKFAGYEEWHPDIMMADLAKKWIFPTIFYKYYPCCGMLHGALNLLYKVMDRYGLKAEEMEKITAYCHPTVAEPAFTNPEVVNIQDAQFNPRYVFAIAAHRITIGVEWQDEHMMRDPKILEYGKRIACLPHPNFGKKGPDGKSQMVSKVEIVARGQTLVEEGGMMGAGRSIEERDRVLVAKFRHNAERVLTQDKINRAIEGFLNLDKLDHVSALMENLSIL